MTNLPNRIQLIISENHFKQKDFAKSINVSESYISKLLKGKCGISNSTAMLIEERYGYSAKWIIDGVGSKKNGKMNGKELTPMQREIISDIKKMNKTELIVMKAFLSSLHEYRKVLDSK